MNTGAIKIAERLGWAVTVQEDLPGMEWVEFQQYTPAGQDFTFSVTPWKDNMWSLCSKIDKYIEGFDADREAAMWQKDGHGVKGAPYHLKHIVGDFEWAEEEIMKLYRALAKYTVEEAS